VIIGLVVEVLGLVIRIPELPKVPNDDELSLTSESDLIGCFPLLSWTPLLECSSSSSSTSSRFDCSRGRCVE